MPEGEEQNPNNPPLASPQAGTNLNNVRRKNGEGDKDGEKQDGEGENNQEEETGPQKNNEKEKEIEQKTPEGKRFGASLFSANVRRARKEVKDLEKELKKKEQELKTIEHKLKPSRVSAAGEMGKIGDDMTCCSCITCGCFGCFTPILPLLAFLNIKFTNKIIDTTAMTMGGTLPDFITYHKKLVEERSNIVGERAILRKKLKDAILKLHHNTNLWGKQNKY